MAFEDLENFLTEGMLMLDFQHKNVMTLIGVVYENGGRPLVVLPYMDNGDLCTLIRKEDVVGQLFRFDKCSVTYNDCSYSSITNLHQTMAGLMNNR